MSPTQVLAALLAATVSASAQEGGTRKRYYMHLAEGVTKKISLNFNDILVQIRINPWEDRIKFQARPSSTGTGSRTTLTAAR